MISKFSYWLPVMALLLALSACSLPYTAPLEGEEEGEGFLLPSLPPAPSSPLCSEPQTLFVTTDQVFQIPALEEPAARLPFRDPVFGTCLVRLTDRSADLAPGDPSAGLKNEYSRIQSFNADGSLILVRGTEATWYLYSAASLAPLGSLPLEVEPRWSANNPTLLYFISGTHLLSYDLRTGGITLVHDFSTEAPGAVMVWTRYEGSPSADGRYWGLMAEDEDWLASFFLIYDLQTDELIALRDLRGNPEDEREIDSVTISPLGDYFLAQMDKYCEPGILGSDSHPCGLMVYDKSLTNGRSLLRIVGHSDTALDATDRQVFVYQDIDNDNLSMLDLESGAITPLLPLDFSHTGFGLHISGRAFAFPGWVLVSTHDGDPASYTWMDDSIFAVELVDGGRILRLAHTHSLVDDAQEQDYWAEPQATTDITFTRLLFTTNWGRSGTAGVETYLVELPPTWLELLPPAVP